MYWDNFSKQGTNKEKINIIDYIKFKIFVLQKTLVVLKGGNSLEEI